MGGIAVPDDEPLNNLHFVLCLNVWRRVIARVLQSQRERLFISHIEPLQEVASVIESVPLASMLVVRTDGK